uniref:DH domain-containing protein n=1 Tax=Biomphalaria glabrata TaxID=6526 RepID=A0A2C9LC42_BIOGL
MNEAVLQAIDSGATNIAEITLRHPRYLEASKRMRRMGDVEGFFKPERGSQFPSYVTPLILAAQKNEYPIVQLLLQRGESIIRPHKFGCGCQECINKQKFDQLRSAKCRLDAYMGLASEAYVSLYSKDPFLTAFELAQELRQLADSEVFFKKEYTDLADKLSNYVVKLLDRVWTHRELSAVLDKCGAPQDDVYESLSRFKMAVELEEKLFVAHPNCQQRIERCWYEGLEKYTHQTWPKILALTALFILGYPVIVGYFLVAPKSKTERDYVRALQFITGHYVPELQREDVPQMLRGKRTVIFGNLEKIQQFHSQYFLKQLESCQHQPFLVGQYFLQHDILKFFVFAAIVIIAFMVALNNLYWYYSYREDIEVDSNKIERPGAVDAYGSVMQTFRTVFWSIYGRGEEKAVGLGAYNNTMTEKIGETIDALYHISMIILLMNILIAMMTRTFEKTAEDADIEWKFARSALYLEYITKGRVLPVPFNILEVAHSLISHVIQIIRKRQPVEITITDVYSGARRAAITSMASNLPKQRAKPSTVETKIDEPPAGQGRFIPKLRSLKGWTLYQKYYMVWFEVLHGLKYYMAWLEVLHEICFKSHLSDKFNILDFMLLSVYIATYTLKYFCLYKFKKSVVALSHVEVLADSDAAFRHLYWMNADRINWDVMDPINTSEGLFAMANILSFSRISYLLRANEILGPLGWLILRYNTMLIQECQELWAQGQKR